MEVILSAVSPMQLLSGKIAGQACVGLVILIVYSSAGVAALIAAAMFEMIDTMNLVYLFIYFFIAFASIACLFAAVGSAVSDINEAQSLIGPVMIVLVIPMMLWLPILQNPNSTFAQICSFVPPISPFIMVLRLAGSEKVATWQIPASMLVGVLTVFAMAGMACLQPRKTPSTFTACSVRHSSKVVSVTGLARKSPALLTRMSSPPASVSQIRSSAAIVDPVAYSVRQFALAFVPARGLFAPSPGLRLSHAHTSLFPSSWHCGSTPYDC